VSAARQTIAPDALRAFKREVTAHAAELSSSSIGEAKRELDKLAAAESAGRARLAEISEATRELADDRAGKSVAAALIAGRSLADEARSRENLQSEAERLHAGLVELNRLRNVADSQLRAGLDNARRPFRVASEGLVASIAETARQHVAGLLACFAALDALQQAVRPLSSPLLHTGLKDMLARAQIRECRLLERGGGKVDVPEDARAAIGALVALGGPLDFGPVDSVLMP
jgi:hypothetical protein